LVFVVVLCFAVVLGSPVYARSSPTAEDDPCPAPNVRTDVSPSADGQPVKVSVGVRMDDLMEINDINQTLAGDFLPAVEFSLLTHNCQIITRQLQLLVGG
jgi:hypothetical protein